MPLNLRDLQARRADVSAVIEGESEPLKFAYYPHKFTNTSQTRLTTATGLGALVDLLAELMIEWDLQMDGEPWPLTRDNLNALGIPVLTAIAKAIVAHATGQDDRKNSSAG
jgi:hypothetical protein